MVCPRAYSLQLRQLLRQAGGTTSGSSGSYLLPPEDNQGEGSLGVLTAGKIKMPGLCSGFVGGVEVHSMWLPKEVSQSQAASWTGSCALERAQSGSSVSLWAGFKLSTLSGSKFRENHEGEKGSERVERDFLHQQSVRVQQSVWCPCRGSISSCSRELRKPGGSP